MKIIIQTPDFKANRKLLKYTNDSVMKLSDFGDRIIEARVVLKKDKSDTEESKVCELKVVISGNDLFAQKRSSRFEESILTCVEAMKHQIRRWKDSINNGKLRGSEAPAEWQNE